MKQLRAVEEGTAIKEAVEAAKETEKSQNRKPEKSKQSKEEKRHHTNNSNKAPFIFSKSNPNHAVSIESSSARAQME